jgi:hypothetical protein
MTKRKKKFQENIATPDGELFARALSVARSEKLETLVILTRLPLAWLRKFRAGSIRNPSVNRIETLLKTFNQF